MSQVSRSTAKPTLKELAVNHKSVLSVNEHSASIKNQGISTLSLWKGSAVVGIERGETRNLIPTTALVDFSLVACPTVKQSCRTACS